MKNTFKSNLIKTIFTILIVFSFVFINNIVFAEENTIYNPEALRLQRDIQIHQEMQDGILDNSTADQIKQGNEAHQEIADKIDSSKSSTTSTSSTKPIILTQLTSKTSSPVGISGGLNALKGGVEFAETRDVLGGSRAKMYDKNGRIVRMNNFNSGEEILSATMYRAVSLGKNVLAFIAIGLIVFFGAKVVASSDNAEEFKKQRNNIIYSIVGLVIVMMGEPLVSRLFRNSATGGTNYDQTAPTFIDTAIQNTNVFILELINVTMQILAVIAVLVIVIRGAQMMFATDDGDAGKYRSQIVYVAMGLVFVMIAPSLVKVFYGEVRGGRVVSYGLDIKGMASLVGNITKNIMSMAAIIAFAMLVYAGFRLFFGGLNEEGAGKAKKIIINSALGLIMMLMAYVIVDFAVGKLGAVAI